MKMVKVFSLFMLSAALITACGKDKSKLNAADNSAGSVSITASATTLVDGVELTASVSDGDGITSEVRFQWNANGFPITGATSARYVVSDTYAGSTISVSAVYTDDAGFTETLISPSSTEVVPLTSFDDLVAVTASNVAELTGSVTLNGNGVTVAPANLTTSYGAFSIDQAGAWVYTLNTSDATISGLEPDATVNDEIVVEASDGNVAVLVIIITGVETVPAENTQSAVIRDTDGGDTGELRYNLPSAQLAGKLSVSFNKVAEAINTAPGDDTDNKDAYITLFNSATSTSSGRAIADLRIQAEQFALRDQDGIVIANAFKPDTWQDVEITWEAANDVTPPMVTVKIDGVAVTAEAFSSPDGAVGGVTAIAFRFADNSAILATESTFKVDDIMIYSDTVGTTPVFKDDFESYTQGHDLDQDPYASATSEAVVETRTASGGGDNSGGATSGPGISGNQIAAITDTDSSDSGELRYKFEAPMLAGKLVAAFNKPANAIEINDALEAKDAYITLYNSATSTSSGRAIADLRIQTDAFILRDQDGLVVNNPFTPGQWQNVEITWEAANDVTPPMVTVTIDGVSVTTEAFSSPDGAVGGVAAVAFRFADNTAIVPAEISFKVDDIEIYSDAAGTTLVFEDDFESYSDATDLDPNNNGSSVYNSSSFQAVVATEQ